MNKMPEMKALETQGWLSRTATKIFEKFVNSLCASTMGISPAACQEFFYYGGYGWEEAYMYQTVMRTRLFDEEV